MLKAVLDTNVLVSGLIASSDSAPALLIKAWYERKFEPVVSFAILKEVAKVLGRDKIRRYYGHIDKDLPQKYITGLMRFATLVPGELQVRGVCADPDDDKFLAAALEAEADYIVSGDSHLLVLRDYRGVRIVKPGEFLAKIRDMEG